MMPLSLEKKKIKDICKLVLFWKHEKITTCYVSHQLTHAIALENRKSLCNCL